jgi:hypothetical protein
MLDEEEAAGMVGNRQAVEQERRLADELLLRLERRTDRAEDRAKMLLGICAGGASLLAAYSTSLAAGNGFQAVSLQHLILLALTILLLKAVWFSLAVLRPARGYEITPELIDTIRNLPPDNALREEVTWKVWVYNRNQKSAVRKFYAYDRAQRNFIFFVMLLALSIPYVVFHGAAAMLPNRLLTILRYAIGIGVNLLALGADRLLEPAGIWERNSGE